MSAPSPPPQPQQATTRALLVAVGVGALVLAAATTLTTGRPSVASTPVASTPVVATGSVPRTGSLAGDAIGTAGPGTCLTWTAADFSDLGQVPCGDEHLLEVAGTVDLARYPGAELGPDAPFPGTARFTELRDQVCEPVVRSYLDGALDPYGRFTVGLVNPGAQAWAAGERTLRCGLQEVDATGTLATVVGRVAELDQSDVTPVGTCTGIDAGLPTAPVDCAAPHASETVAVVDLAAEFPGGPPSEADQDGFLEGTCTQSADDYTGAPGGAAAAELTVFWDDLRAVSWLAGSRRVNCYVGRAVPEGGFAPVTGSARGTAPAPDPGAPGAPGPAPAPGTAPTPTPAPATPVP